MAFKRFGGTIETKNIGGEKFAEIRLMAVVLGLPLSLVSGALNPQIGAVSVISAIAYFILGMAGEFSIKVGFYIVLLIAVVSSTLAIWLSSPYYIALALCVGFNLFQVWNGYFLFKRVRC